MKRALPAALHLFLITVFASGCGDDTTSPSEDTSPPVTVRNLSAVASAQGDSISLYWTAPGDDGGSGQAAEYEIRYLATVRQPSDWDHAAALESPPRPQPGGTPEEFTTTELTPGTWYFVLRSADEAANWSGLSNTAVAWEPDLIPPSSISDLAPSSSSFDQITLSWTAPGDNGDVGFASRYDLRYSTEPVTEENWPNAIPADGLLAPLTAGNSETATVSRLEPGTTYYFAIRAADEVPNWSPMSNVATGVTRSGELYQLTKSYRRIGATGPTWSPDGGSILFVADWVREFEFELYVVDPDGERTRWIRTAQKSTGPSWSPDGTSIVFVSDTPEGNPREIWAMDAPAGTNPRRLHVHEDRNIQSCAWSPDGSKIAYAAYTTPSWPDGGEFTAEIHIADLETGASHQWSEGGVNNRAPAWSPDGEYIAFQSDRGGDYDIWVAPTAGGEPVQLTDSIGSDIQPAWSPDGTEIAFSSEREGARSIWVMSATGENARKVAVVPDAATLPTWSPDGTRICFVASVDFQGDLWVVRL